MMPKLQRLGTLACAVVLCLAAGEAQATFSIGAASDYAVLVAPTVTQSEFNNGLCNGNWG